MSALGPLTSMPAATILVFIAAVATSSDYSRHFGEGWHLRQVSGGDVTLSTDPDHPCAIKAYGWKLLDTEWRRDNNAAWYTIPDTFQKWAFRFVVRNKASKEQSFSADVRLMSDDGFQLDSNRVDSARIRSRSIEVVSGTAWYNATEATGEGSPQSVTWEIICSDREPNLYFDDDQYW